MTAVVRVVRKAPLLIEQPGGPLAKGVAGALTWRSDHPALVTVCAATVEIHLTIEGFTDGLISEHCEPYGGVTVRPRRDVTDGRWLTVDVADDMRVTVAAARAWQFLADVALAACVGGVRLPVAFEGLEDLPSRPLRSEGGAA